MKSVDVTKLTDRDLRLLAEAAQAELARRERFEREYGHLQGRVITTSEAVELFPDTTSYFWRNAIKLGHIEPISRGGAGGRGNVNSFNAYDAAIYYDAKKASGKFRAALAA